MYGSASELRATLEYDFSQEKDFGDAKVDIQDEKVDIESVLSEKSSDFSVKRQFIIIDSLKSLVLMRYLEEVQLWNFLN